MTGRIEIITGPMFSGKTDELIRRINLVTISSNIRGLPNNVLVVKPDRDTRSDDLKSHDGSTWPARTVPANRPTEIIELVEETACNIIGIEEVQFFENTIVEVVQILARKGKRIIAAGLDLDYCDKPFGPIGGLLAIADHIDKLTAICSICGNPATKSQKIVADDSLVYIGAAKEYEPRCRQHYNHWAVPSLTTQNS